MKGRIFDPKVGRFLTPDPVVPNPLFGQSWNAYTYVLNNPLGYIDPSGFDEEVPHSWVGYDPNGTGGLGLFCCSTQPPPPPPSPPAETKEEAQERANTEAMLTATRPVPVDVGTTGTNAGFLPLRVPTDEPGTTSSSAEGDRSWREHPVLQIEGGFVGGMALGYVPGASPVMHLLGQAGALDPGTREARVGRAIGEMVGGFLLGVSGVGMVLTGGGAPVGAAALAASAALVTAGLVSMGVGAWEYNQAMMSTGSGSGGAAGRGPPGTKIPESELRAPPAKRGNAPTGNDGHPVELHHRGQKPDSPLDEMTRTEHRGAGNFSKNHSNTGQEPSQIDRKAWKQEQREYWEKEWDNGRFNDK